MPNHSHASKTISKGTVSYRKWGVTLEKNWCPYPDLSSQLILMILVSNFLYSYLVSITIIKMLKIMDQKGQNDQKTKFRTSIAFYPSFQASLVSKYLYWWVVYRKIIKKWKKDQKGQKWPKIKGTVWLLKNDKKCLE